MSSIRADDPKNAPPSHPLDGGRELPLLELLARRHLPQNHCVVRSTRNQEPGLRWQAVRCRVLALHSARLQSQATVHTAPL